MKTSLVSKKFNLAEAVPDVKAVRVYENGNACVIRESVGTIDRFIERTTLQEDDKVSDARSVIRYEKVTNRGGIRSVVREFSTKSRVRMAWILSNTVLNFTYMSTLTYGEFFPKDNKTINKHRERILSVVRRYYDKMFGTSWKIEDSVGYFWFLEFQKRGAVHLHILLSHYVDGDAVLSCWLRCNKELKNNLSEVRYVHSRLSNDGYPFIMQYSGDDGGLKRYGIKYSLKMYQKVPPEWFNGRFYGYSKNIKIEVRSTILNISEEDLRGMLLEHRVANFDVVPKYIFSCLEAEVAKLLFNDD